MLQHNLKGLEKITKNNTAYRTFLKVYLGPYKWERALAVTELSFCSADRTNTSVTEANWIVLKSQFLPQRHFITDQPINAV